MLMDEEKPYTDETLNRDVLAQMLGTNAKYVEQAIRQCSKVFLFRSDQKRKARIIGLLLKWWWGKDSNLGRRKPADLQSALVDRLSIPPFPACPPGNPNGARGGTRTRKDLSTCTSSMRVCQFHHPSAA